MSNIRTHFGQPVFGRRTSLAQAELQIDGRHPFNCTVHQIDEDGAEIELSRPIALPKRIRLHWEQFGDGADCNVVGTDGPTVRVAFTSEAGAAILRRFEVERASQRQRAGI